MKDLFEYNKKCTEHNKTPSNMKIFKNKKKFTEYNTSSKYKNASLNIKVFL